jgi:DNA-binding response OmpR family regulator
MDDEPDIGNLVRDVAEPMGFEVLACTDPRSFAQNVNDFAPTDILLDIVMPDVDGIELIRWLATQGTTARITAMTGVNTRYAELAGSIASSLGLGTVRTLAKPASIKELRRHLAAGFTEA